VTAPKDGDVLSRSQPYTVTWAHTPSDAPRLSIGLSNNHTDFYRQLANDIDTKLGSYTVSLAQGFDGPGYQILLAPYHPGTGDAALSGYFSLDS